MMKFLRKIALGVSACMLIATAALAQVPPSPPSYSILGGGKLLSVGTSSSRTALPASAVPYGALTLYNSGVVDVNFALGGSTITADTTNVCATSTGPSCLVPAGKSIVIWAGNNTWIAAITATSSSPLYIYQGNGPLGLNSNGGTGGSGSGPCAVFGTTAGTCAQGNDSRITGALQAANNLSDVASSATSLTNLGGIGAATTNTLTNKTYDSAGTGNVFKISGTTITGLSGTGGVICTSVGSACTGGGGAVSSVFGRTGAVVSATNDYSFAQLSGTAAPGQLPLATTGAFGAVKCDGTTISCTAGVIASLTGGGGNVTGPGSAVSGNIVTFNGTSGTLIQDSGSSIASLAPAGLGAVITTSNSPTAADWRACKTLTANGAAITVTVPASSTLQANGGCLFITTLTNTVTLAPNAADNINGGTTGASKTLPANSTIMITTDGVNALFAGTNATTGTGLNVLATSPTISGLTLTGTASGAATIPNSMLITDPTNASNLSSGTVAAARMPAFSGDATSSAGATALTLATVNGSPGSVGSSTAIPVITTNGKGLVTSQTTAAVIAPAGTLTGTTLASGVTTAPGITSINGSTVPTAVDTFALLAATQTLTNKTINGSNNTLTNIANASLSNSSVTVGGQTISLGGNTTNQGTGGKIQLSTGTTTTGDCAKYDAAGNVIDATVVCAVGANPTATIGATAVNGTSLSFMRADAAPALPATLPALSGVNLTNLNASAIASGIVPAANGGAGAISGILKANGSGVVSAAVSSTDYAPATSGGSILYGNGSGGFSNVTIGANLTFSAGTLSGSSGSGTVTSVAPATTSPAITVNGGSSSCTTACTIGIQEALSPNSASFANASYTIQTTDLGTTLPRTNTSAMTDTMPDIGTTGFGQGVSVNICTGPVASAAKDTVSAASASKFMYGTTLASSVVIPPGTCAKFTNTQNTNWAVSGIPWTNIGTTLIGNGTNKALEYNNNGIAGELAVVNNAVVVTSGTGVPSESVTLPSGLAIPGATLSGSTALGTIASGDLTNGTNYPVASLSGLGANVAASLAASASGSSGGFCRSVGSACSGQAGGGVITYSSGALTALTAGTYYAPFGGGGSPVATETAVQTRSPAASTVTNLQVDLSVDPGNTNTVVVTARDNASDQTSTCTITGNGSTNLSCSDITNSFNPAQGDNLTFKIVNSATYTGTINITGTWGTTNVGVTGVTVTVPSRQTATGCVISTSGTCAITDNTQNKNLIFSGPSSGSAAAPTFRSLVTADMPVVCPAKYIANNWYNVNGSLANATTVFLAAGSTNTIVWTPFTVCQTVTISNIGISLVTSGGTNGNLSLYADSGGLPTGSFICGSSVSTGSTGAVTMACSTQLVQGTIYWFGTNEDSATAKASAQGFAAGSLQLVGTSSSANFGAAGAERLTTTSVTCCTTGSLPTNPTIVHTANGTTYQTAIYLQVASIP